MDNNSMLGLGCIIGIGYITLMLIASGSVVGYLMLAGIIALISYIVYANKRDAARNKAKQEEKERNYQSAISLYKESATKIMFPQTGCFLIECVSAGSPSSFIERVSYFLWRDNENCYFFPQEPTLDNFGLYMERKELGISIPLQDIVMFCREGEFFRETKISGGGADVAGAFVGGMLFGAAGAVVGGREAVRSQLIEHDTRHVQLILRENHQEYTITFLNNTYDSFFSIFPEKEKTIIEEIQRRRLIETGMGRGLHMQYLSNATQDANSPSISLEESSHKRRRLRRHTNE